MKLTEALAVIGSKTGRAGFVVSFELRERGMLRSDHFPDVRAGEEGLSSEEDAWRLATQFAHARGRRIVNVYVCHADDFTPVRSYRSRMLNVYPNDGASDVRQA